MRHPSAALFVAVLTSLSPIHWANAELPTVPTPETPPTLSVQPGQTLKLVANAKGVQIYVCGSRADTGKMDWILKAPEANLYDSAGQLIGTHFAGPSWEAVDGSKVVGLVKAKVEQEQTIAWLLLGASANTGTGVFAHTTAIQRLNTRDGKAPVAGCDAGRLGSEIRIPYTAQYYFYD